MDTTRQDKTEAPNFLTCYVVYFTSEACDKPVWNRCASRIILVASLPTCTASACLSGDLTSAADCRVPMRNAKHR